MARNNESTEILQMLNSAFGDLAANAEVDLYPVEHGDTLRDLNELVYNDINNGVYVIGINLFFHYSLFLISHCSRLV